MKNSSWRWSYLLFPPPPKPFWQLFSNSYSSENKRSTSDYFLILFVLQCSSKWSVKCMQAQLLQFLTIILSKSLNASMCTESFQNNDPYLNRHEKAAPYYITYTSSYIHVLRTFKGRDDAYKGLNVNVA